MSTIKKLVLLSIGTLILSLVGFYNGYPLVYSDTGTYVFSGMASFIPNDRPITYGLFIKFFSLRYSAWFVVLVQNFLTAFVLYQTLKLFQFKQETFNRFFYLLLLFLVVFTGIGWYSNQLMPDFFAPLAILSIFILIVGKEISIASKILLGMILIYSLVTHLSHLLIASSTIAVVLALKFFLKNKLKDISYKKIILTAGVVFSSWIVLPSINYVVEKQFILSKCSHIFLMAHFNDTGILKTFLNDKCTTPEYKDCKLCLYKDSLPTDLASFIWSDKILNNTGGWNDSKDEYNKIIKGILKEPKYIGLNIHRTIFYGLIQTTKFEIGQGLASYGENTPPYGVTRDFFNSELNNYINSRQIKWNGSELNLDLLNSVHSILIIASLFVFILLMSNKNLLANMDSNTILLLLFCLIGILLNAFITAGLNSPCERFQARVVWLLPFSLAIVLYKNYSLIFATLFKKWNSTANNDNSSL